MNETCGCCEGLEASTPLVIANRPGLSRLAYRAGTHATFLATMKARLSASDYPALRKGLTTRSATDPAIVLLDAWATVADVLTFYQERVANEGYLRTATERHSILELARLIGYALRPGVAASVYLAFTLDDGSNVEIPAGTRAQSVPGPGELPQPFETGENLQARADWNILRPRTTRPQPIVSDDPSTFDTLYFQDAATDLNPNDALLFVFGERADQQSFRRVATVEAQPLPNRTRATLQTDAATAPPAVVARAEAVLTYHSDPSMFNVNPRGRIAQEIADSLKALRSNLRPDISRRSLVNSLEQEIGSLREKRPYLNVRYTNLRTWLRSTVTGLGEVLDDLSARSAAPEVIAVDELVGPLQRPPSNQPANSLRLERDLAQTFERDSDAVARLLVSHDPALQATLYAAWANANVTERSALESAQALRVTAAPFGHSAPPKPIYNRQGVIGGNEEWTLAGTNTVTISVRLFPRRALLSITRNGETRSEQVPLVDGSTEVLESEATVNVDSNNNQTDFEFSDPSRAFKLKSDSQGPEVKVEISGDRERSLIPNQALRYSIGQRRISIAYEPPSQVESAFISIEDESPAQEGIDPRVLTLNARYDEIVRDSWVVIRRPAEIGTGRQVIIRKIVHTETLTITNYGIPATEVTQLTLDKDWLFPTDTSLAVLRNTTVFAQGELLVLAEEPVEDEIQGDTIELDSLYDGLESGRWLIVSGERTDIPGTSGVTASEVVMLAGVMQTVQRVELEGQEQDLPDDKTHSFLKLARPLAYRYKRDTVTIYGNVVRATHGETRAEVLGSGDSSKMLQQFSLKQAPLTYVAATTPSGAESTLHVFVDDVRWHEVERLVGLEPTDHRFVTRASDEDEVMLTFGDGKRGARLPTGMENVRAVYRTGIGKPGNVEAKQISQLATRPLGLKDVINPLPATGGADRESRDQARRNTPLALMALDRLVSVQDYADFARTFAGIGKASAARLSDGYRQLVHLTIAGAEDIPIAEGSDLYRNLVQALRQFGDPQQPLRVEIRELIMLIISAKVRVVQDYLWESVEPKVRAALLDTFSFERRELGQDALLSEVISTIQRVPGVAYVDVDSFGGVSEKTTDAIAVAIQTLVTECERDGPQLRVTVDLAGSDGGPIYPAQLAFLTPDVPDTLILREITA